MYFDNSNISTKFRSPSFKNWFQLILIQKKTCWFNLECFIDIKFYGRYSFGIIAKYALNYVQKPNENDIFYELPPSRLEYITEKIPKKHNSISQIVIRHAISDGPIPECLAAISYTKQSFHIKCITYNELFQELNLIRLLIIVQKKCFIVEYIMNN